jgi:MATE family multidrug resistance protein
VESREAPPTPAIDHSPLGEVVRIAGPTVATMTSYTIMTFVDKWLVSHIGPEPIYVGAQGNGGLTSWVAISVAHGTLTIVNTFVSQNYGAGKPERAPAYVWNSLWIGLAYWLVVLLPLAFALPGVFAMFVRGEGDASGMDPRQAAMSGTYGSILLYGAFLTLAGRCFSQFFYGMHKPGVVMVAGVTANVFNLVLSCVLTFGNAPPPEGLGAFGGACHAIGSALNIAPMGIAGSAIGTVLATGVELIIPAMVFLGRDYHGRFATRTPWRWSRSHVRELLKMGWPAGLMFGNEMICWGYFMVYLVSGFGPHHANAGWIAHQYMSLSFMPAVGLSVATTALVGKYQGMGRSDLAASRAWLCTRIACAYMGVCAAVFLLFPGPLMGLFIDGATPPEDVAALQELGRKFLIATAAFQLFDGMAMVLSGALRGAGDTTVPGVATIVCSWAIIVGGGTALTRWAPQLESLGAWIAAATYIAALCVFLLLRFVSGKWRTIKVVREE